MQATRHTSIAALIIALMTIAVMPVSAQGTAEAWLDKATEKLQNKGVEMAFRINEEGIRISGKLLIEGEKFTYDTEEMKIWYDGTTQWTLQTGSGYNELYVNNPTLEEQQSINPHLLLSNYRSHFTVTDGGEKSHLGKTLHLVKLEPNDESIGVENINIYIANDGTLAAIEFIPTNGTTYKIDVRSMQTGLTFPKGTFTYPEKTYPADEVIDLR